MGAATAIRIWSKSDSSAAPGFNSVVIWCAQQISGKTKEQWYSTSWQAGPATQRSQNEVADVAPPPAQRREGQCSTPGGEVAANEGHLAGPLGQWLAAAPSACHLRPVLASLPGIVAQLKWRAIPTKPSLPSLLTPAPGHRRFGVWAPRSRPAVVKTDAFTALLGRSAWSAGAAVGAARLEMARSRYFRSGGGAVHVVVRGAQAIPGKESRAEADRRHLPGQASLCGRHVWWRHRILQPSLPPVAAEH